MWKLHTKETNPGVLSLLIKFNTFQMGGGGGGLVTATQAPPMIFLLKFAKLSDIK